MQSSRYAAYRAENKGPEVFYGYCHESGRMRMMDYNDFMTNLGKGYSNLYRTPAGVAIPTALNPYLPARDSRRCQCGCGCHGQQDDCGCNCCIQCADAIEYAYCGETRKIPITFDNDSRREREVSVQIGDFATDSGHPLGWKTAISETKFTLAPCGQKTILIMVNIDCRQENPGSRKDTAANRSVADRGGAVESCKVGYAKVSADGCLIRPIIVAIAVLPDHCGAQKIGCLCGCC